MNYLAQVQRGIDYIEHHLDAEIALGDVARHAGISQWHFQRIFKSLTNETLKTYIRSRRFADSLDRLATTDERILDIALRAGFGSQQSFTRSFKKAFDVTPNRYRKLGNRRLFVTRARFDKAYLRHLHRNVSLTPQLHQRPPMKLVGLRTEFFGVDSHKNNLGDKLPSLWAAFMARLHEVPSPVQGTCYGVIHPVADDGDRLVYLAAIEVSEHQALPPKMAQLSLPKATYASFEHRGDPVQIDRTVSYAYATWLTQSGRRHSQGADLEVYGQDYKPGCEASVMHYAIPIH